MRTKLHLLIFITVFFCCEGISNSEDLIDTSKLKMRPIESMNIGGNLFPSSEGASALRNVGITESYVPEYDLSRMLQTYPDFTTYPDEQGIIWLKHVTFSESPRGGLDVTRLYVILCRQGIDTRWLNWNIQTPNDGIIEELEAEVYDFPGGTKITSVTASLEENGITPVKFMGMPERFIVALSWREHLPKGLSLEGLSYFQEDLRVWESVVEIQAPEALTYRTFPEFRRPDTERGKHGITYTWRIVNIDPYDVTSGLVRVQRSGIVFGTRKGNAGLTGIMKNIEDIRVPLPSEAEQTLKRSGVNGLIEWLKVQPEIELAEGTPRSIPTRGAWTRTEKIMLARSWLSSHKKDTVLHWQLPFEPDDTTPINSAMFELPILEADKEYYDMRDSKLLAGAKIYTPSNEGKLVSRRIASTKSTDNKLSAIMEMKLNEHGMMSGTVRIILRGAWGGLMLGSNPTNGTARGAVLSLFPGLTHIKEVRYKGVKGTPEIIFTIENKPGIGGSGKGILAVIPFFEPKSMRAIGSYEAPIELKFPFIVEQTITLNFPRNVKEALLSGKTERNPDKINYTDVYQNRRHRLIAASRIELNVQTVTSGNMALLRKCLNQWRTFSSRNIPLK